jgi:IS5 family transposase
MEIARASRSRGKGVEEKRKRSYQRLFTITGQVVRQAERTSQAVTEMKRRPQPVRRMQQELDRMIGLVRQVMRQAKARIFTGDTHFTDKVVSVFEPQTEVIRKGKASKPTEFGKMVKIQEAENQIITSYEVYGKRPNDSDLLVKAVEEHRGRLGQVPDLVAADAAFHSPTNKTSIEKMGVRYVSVPNRPTKNAALRKIQKSRWFRKGQKWRTGSEGRISVLKRRHGLDRCRYRGDDGMGRWVGLAVIADNLINMGRVLATQT